MTDIGGVGPEQPIVPIRPTGNKPVAQNQNTPINQLAQVTQENLNTFTTAANNTFGGGIISPNALDKLVRLASGVVASNDNNRLA